MEGAQTVTTTPDSVVYYRTIPTTVLVTTLEGRRKDLENAINQARKNGQITPEQSVSMKHELHRIGQQTSSATISYPTALMVAQDLDLIGQQYGTIVTTAPTYVPIITGTTFVVSSDKTYKLDDLSVRRAQLDARIIKDVLQGRLSDSRATELRNELANIGAEANLYTANGSFDAKESRRLYDAFDHVASQIDKWAGKDKPRIKI